MDYSPIFSTLEGTNQTVNTDLPGAEPPVPGTAVNLFWQAALIVDLHREMVARIMALKYEWCPCRCLCDDAENYCGGFLYIT